jgi:hypothetical protein
MKSLLLSLFLLLSAGAAAGAAADEPRELNWQDLAPDMESIHNPFLELSYEQTDIFREYLEHRATSELEHTVEQQQRQRELVAILEADGFKPDEMYKQYYDVVAQYQLAMTSTSPEVLGQEVKLPGFLLPLNVKDGAVIEFLLVPTIGACIHEPIPSANQMVYVRFEKGFKDAGMFDPVWIQGELKADSRTEQLDLVDGASGVQVSYSMDAKSVWLY